MKDITIGEIGIAVTFLVGLISGIGYLHSRLKSWVTDALKDQLNSIDKNFDEMSRRIDTVDLENCKNFLVRFLADVEQGKEIDEIELQRFYEEYEHYTRKGGNSYIRHKVDKLKEEGKL